jgi:anti-sigma factor RsiW
MGSFSFSDIMMGSCEETARLLSDYADHELPLRRRLRLRIHFAFCERCRAVLAGLEATLASLRALALVEPPPDPELPGRVVERIRSQGPGRNR